MLVSSADFFRVQPQAKTHFGCAGNGRQYERQFSPLCERIIRRGDEYVEQLALLGVGYKGKVETWVVSRHCVHCAMAFMSAISVDLEGGGL